MRGTGRTGVGLVRGRSTGTAPWEAGTGFAAPRQEAASETPKQLCSEVVGRGPGGTGWDPRAPSPACVIRAVGDREGTLLRRAHSGLGVQCF